MSASLTFVNLEIGRDGPKGDIGGRCQSCRPGEKGLKGEPGLYGNPGIQVITLKWLYLINTCKNYFKSYIYWSSVNKSFLNNKSQSFWACCPLKGE